VRSQKEENSYLKKVGDKIRELRIKAGLTQEEIEEFHISWKHYQKIETGKTNTTLRLIYRLSKAFKCNPKDLLP